MSISVSKSMPCLLHVGASALALTLGCGDGSAPELDSAAQGLDGHPLNPGAGGKHAHGRNSEKHESSTGSTSSTTPITYHGGPVMTGTVNVYYIWYGNWTDGAKSILTDLASNIGGSSWYSTNTSYYDSSGTAVSNSVTFGGSTRTGYAYGTVLSDTTLWYIVEDAVSLGRLPTDPNGVYFVLTSSDVAVGGFCTQYCGWHTSGKWNGVDIKYSWVGNADRCLDGCAAQSASSPNGDPGADGTASVIAHELSETVTDPKGSGWYDSNGDEDADKCAWTFGSEFAASNGSRANVFIGSRPFLLQRNWVNSGSGGCALGYNYSKPTNRYVAIKSYANGEYVTADPSSPQLIANRTAVGGWEKFYIGDQGSGYVSFLANSNGDYVCADTSGTAPLIANRTTVGSWEKFKWIELGSNHFALQANVNSKIVCAENGGQLPLIANRSTIGSWEIFQWESQ